MASKNQVTLTFAGDSEKLEKAFDNVGTAAGKMETKVDTASSGVTGGFDKVGGGLDSLDEKAGGVEAGFRGTMDVMGGMGKLAEGDVLGGITDLGGGVSSLAQGFGAVLVPMMQKTVGWMAQTRVGMLAQAAASKVAAAGQWLLNAAMSANPIALVIIAIVALVAIFVIAYKKSETFRNIVQGALRGVGKAVSWLGDRFSDWWKATNRIIGRVTGAFRGIPARLRSAFGGLFNIITAPFRAAFNFVASAWNNTIGRLSWRIPGWVPGIGGNSISAPRLPRFHSGGTVPGAPGSEMLGVLQAGEKITPAGAPAGMTLVVAAGDGASGEQALVQLVLHLVRTGALSLRVREGAVVV